MLGAGILTNATNVTLYAYNNILYENDYGIRTRHIGPCIGPCSVLP